MTIFLLLLIIQTHCLTVPETTTMRRLACVPAAAMSEPTGKYSACIESSSCAGKRSYRECSS